MNETLEKVIELPVVARGGILAAFLSLLVGAYWYLFYQSVFEELTKVEEETKNVQLEVAEKQRIAANLPKFEAEVERLNVELRKALSELPDEKEIPQLLERIADKAKGSGLDVKLFRPKVEQRKDFYAEVPVEIEVEGGYHQVATFFDEVSRLERIVNIDQFSMIEPKVGEQGRNMKTALVANSFRFLDEAERPKPDEAAGGKRRRNKAAKKGASKDE